MKLLIASLFLLSACGGKKSEKTSETKTDTAQEVSTTVTPPDTGDTIVGIPKRLGKIDVAGHDFPNLMIWDEAKAACASLGAGWRLPTEEELNEIYKNKEAIGGGFTKDLYWNSFETDSFNAGCQNFFNGKPGSFSKIYSCRARAVRTAGN